MRTIRDRLLSLNENSLAVLQQYQQVLTQSEVEATNSLEQSELLLAGLVIERNDRLVIKNKIYATIFDQTWTTKEIAKLQE